MDFDIANGRIRVKPQTLMLAELRQLWEADDSPNKELATDILTYIHIAAQVDEEAPFFSAREDEVKELAKGNVWFNRVCPFDLVTADSAIKAYRKSKEVGELRTLKIFNKKIDQLQDKIDLVEPQIIEKLDKNGMISGFASNMGMITKIMSELNPLLDEKEKLVTRMKKTSEVEKSYKAGKKQNLLEKRLLANATRTTSDPRSNISLETGQNNSEVQA
jgi:hypothetical protein